MLADLNLLIEGIERSSYVTADIVPFKLVDAFAAGHSPSIGMLMLQLSREGLTFEFPIIPIHGYEEAYDAVKSTTDRAEKIIYALYFLGLFNQAAEKHTLEFIKKLTGEEEF